MIAPVTEQGQRAAGYRGWQESMRSAVWQRQLRETKGWRAVGSREREGGEASAPEGRRARDCTIGRRKERGRWMEQQEDNERGGRKESRRKEEGYETIGWARGKRAEAREGRERTEEKEEEAPWGWVGQEAGNKGVSASCSRRAGGRSRPL